MGAVDVRGVWDMNFSVKEVRQTLEKIKIDSLYAVTGIVGEYFQKDGV